MCMDIISCVWLFITHVRECAIVSYFHFIIKRLSTFNYYRPSHGFSFWIDCCKSVVENLVRLCLLGFFNVCHLKSILTLSLDLLFLYIVDSYRSNVVWSRKLSVALPHWSLQIISNFWGIVKSYMFPLTSSILFTDLCTFLSLYNRSVGSVRSRYLRLSHGISTCTGSGGW
jgi:hypothetical protein